MKQALFFDESLFVFAAIFNRTQQRLFGGLLIFDGNSHH